MHSCVVWIEHCTIILFHHDDDGSKALLAASALTFIVCQHGFSIHKGTLSKGFIIPKGRIFESNPKKPFFVLLNKPTSGTKGRSGPWSG